MLINQLKKKKNALEDESSTKQGRVLPVFQKLGWDIFNTEEVFPEYSTESGRVDYSLMSNNQSKVFVEVKKVSEDLKNHEDQLLRYCYEAGVKLAILTNGTVWWFYLPLISEEWSQRRFHAIEINKQDTITIVESFEKFLNKNSVISGEALKQAKKIHNNKKIKNLLKETIPKAWNNLIHSQNEKLYKLISDETENIIGHKPENELIGTFIKNLHSVKPVKMNHSKPNSKFDQTANDIKTNEKKYLRHEKNSHISKTPQNIKKIKSFTFNGNEYPVRNSKGVLLQLLNILYNLEKSNFNKVFLLEGRNRPYFSRDSSDLRYASLIEGTDIYAETNRSTPNIIDFSYELLNHFGYSQKCLEINYYG